jgi:hypothetical protein
MLATSWAPRFRVVVPALDNPTAFVAVTEKV